MFKQALFPIILLLALGHIVAFGPWWEPIIKAIAQAFSQALNAVANAIWNALVSGFRAAVDALIVEPLIRFGVALPTFEKLEYGYFLSTALSDAMNRIYSCTVIAGYGVLGIALALSGLWLISEAVDLVHRGEAMATMKRVLLAAVVIPVSKYLYDAAALGIAMINSTILDLDAFRVYAATSVGLLVSVSVGLGLLGGWALLMGLAMVAFLLLVLGAMRFMLIAVLAVLLPIAIALSVFPLSFVRNIGTTLISMLVNLMLATTVCSAIFALGASMGSILGTSLAENCMKLVIFFACLLAPALSLVVAPRASIGLYVTSVFLSYAFKPWIGRLAQQLRPQLRYGISALQQVPGVGRIVRVGTKLYRLSKQPGGAYSAIGEWLWKKRHPELVPIYEELKRRVSKGG